MNEHSPAGTEVRPARFDRPLHPGHLDARYSDPQLERLVFESAERARESARAQGYAAGWSQGRQAAAQQAQDEAVAAAAQRAEQDARIAQSAQHLMHELSQAAAQVREQTLPQWQEVAELLATGAVRLAAAALGRELRSVDDVLLTSITQAVQQVLDPQDAVVRLHPQDAATVGELPAGVRVLPDPQVPSGGVVVLTSRQRLELDLPAALTAAEEVLRT